MAFDALNRLPVEGGDERSVATVHLGLAVAGARTGAPERAREALGEAARRLGNDPADPLTQVYRRVAAFVDREPLGPLPELRPTRRPAVAAMLRCIVDATMAEGPPTLEVGLDGAWVAVDGGPPIQMTRRPVLQRLLKGLVDGHGADPEAALTTDELFAYGWPGETIDVGSARNRTRVALARLRKLGLHAVIERVPDGVRIAPAVEVIRGDSPSDQEH